MTVDGENTVYGLSSMVRVLNETAGFRQQGKGGVNRPAVHLARNCEWLCMGIDIIWTVNMALFYYKHVISECEVFAKHAVSARIRQSLEILHFFSG